jgi:hypothetical protein
MPRQQHASPLGAPLQGMTAQSTGGRVKADTAVETAILREAIKKEDKHIHLRQDFRVTDPLKSAYACEHLRRAADTKAVV